MCIVSWIISLTFLNWSTGSTYRSPYVSYSNTLILGLYWDCTCSHSKNSYFPFGVPPRKVLWSVLVRNHTRQLVPFWLEIMQGTVIQFRLFLIDAKHPVFCSGWVSRVNVIAHRGTCHADTKPIPQGHVSFHGSSLWPCLCHPVVLGSMVLLLPTCCCRVHSWIPDMASPAALGSPLMSANAPICIWLLAGYQMQASTLPLRPANLLPVLLFPTCVVVLLPSSFPCQSFSPLNMHWRCSYFSYNCMFGKYLISPCISFSTLHS